MKLIINGPTDLQENNPMTPFLRYFTKYSPQLSNLWSVMLQLKFIQALHLGLQSGGLQHFPYHSKYILYCRFTQAIYLLGKFIQNLSSIGA